MTKAAELAKMGEVLTNSQIGGRRNIVINGAMQVAQRGTSSTGQGASSNFLIDRFRQNHNGNSAGRYTVSQATDVHDGFANALKLDCTTADTSIGSAERFFIEYPFEGQDLQQFKKGTSDAEDFMVSFYAKANGNFTYVCGFYDQDNNRTVSRTFSVTSSWQRFTINFGKDTTGAFDDDNALSLQLRWYLHAGSNYTGGTLQETWDAVTNNETAGGMTSSFFSSTDNEFYLTGVQLEVGSQATPFEHLSYGEQRQLCYRYYYRTPDSVAGGHGANETFPCVGNMDGTFTGAFMFIFPVPMRAAPTAIEQSGTASDYSIRVTGDSNGTSVPTAGGFTSEKALVNLVSSGAGFTSGDGAFMRMEDTDAFIAFSAEL
jgi:hypothetical protein